MYLESRDLLIKIDTIIERYRDPYTGHLNLDSVSKTAQAKVARLVSKATPKNSAMKFDGLAAIRHYAALKFTIPTAALVSNYVELTAAELDSALDSDNVIDEVWAHMPYGISAEPGSALANIDWEIKPHTNGEEVQVLIMF